MYIHDIYVLGESSSFELKTREEAVVDLELEKVPPCYHTLLTGKVLYRDLPISKATVMVMDNNYRPLSSTVTDENGIYRFYNMLKPGKYKVIASASKYETSNTKIVLIRYEEVTRLSFTLKKSLLFDNGIVYGKVLETESGKPVEDAGIYLKSLACEDNTIYKTMSNHNGQYLIYNILPESYKMIVQKEGYMEAEPSIIKIEKQSRIVLYFDLIKKSHNDKNTISGRITFYEKPLPGVPVFLYRLDKEETEKIVQIQETNENGLYLFSNVKSGTYLVKGKLQNSVIYEKSFIIS